MRLNAQQYQMRNYSVKEGIGQSQVFSLLQDRRGYLWMGTRGGGLTRFDGVEFTHYTTKEGLVNNYIYKIIEDKNGNLWIATSGGISYFNGKSFINFRNTGNLSDVFDICLDSHGTLYAATGTGLFQLHVPKPFVKIASVFEKLAFVSEAVYSVAADRNDKIWFGTAKGVYRLQSGNKKDLFLSGRYINKIYCDHSGKIWVGTYGNGLFYWSNDKFRQFLPGKFPEMKEVYEIYQDKKGEFWFGTLSQGIYRYDTLTKRITNIREKDGLCNNHVRCIISDREGNFWFGTSGGGVCHYFGMPFTHYDRESGLPGNFIYSVFADKKKRIWAGTSNLGIALLDSGKFKTFGAENGFINTKVKSILEDGSGNYYLGTEGDGLYQMKFIRSDSFHIQKIKLLRNAFVRGMCLSQDGSIWVATAGLGLYHLEKGEKDPENLVMSHYTEAEGILSNRLVSVCEDGSGNIWYATESNGVGIFEKGELKHHSTSAVLKNIPLRSLVMDRLGYLWAGTAGEGVYCWKPGEIPQISAFRERNKQLTSQNMYLIAFDTKGNVFLGSESGLDYIELDKNRKWISVKHYGKSEGFLGIETCQNAVAEDVNGNIWFGTVNGLTSCNPAAFTKNPIAPALGLSGIRLFYKNISQTTFHSSISNWGEVKLLDLPHDQNHITFDLRAISFSNPGNVAYQWKLQGFDPQWSPESRQNYVTYSNIPPGDYVFLVKARNSDGVWNQTPLSIPVSIHAPFWQTWWFRTMIITILAFIIWIVFRARFNTLRKKAREAETRLILDKKVSDLEHQALRLQMNPHFIFNALNSIQSQIGEQNEQRARYYLAKFGRLMRQILDNSRKQYISLKEEVETLENYLLVEKFSSGDTFDYEINTDPNMDMDFIKIPPMLLQPFVENSIKHGFKNLQQRRGNILIEFRELEHKLICTISDNGVGREIAQERADSEGESYHESTALKVIRERLMLMDPGNAEPKIDIQDLYSKQGIPCGTKITIEIPIS